MFDFIGELFESGASIIGGLFGGGRGGLFGGGGQTLGLGMQILQGQQGGMFGSPMAGHMMSAIGQQLMMPTAEDREREMRRAERARHEERQRYIRSNYGLSPL